ncbi:MAG: phosphate acyltransferase PlsX, partial [Kofleriaceae bacterium]|nr:phosphate acyltransferase PlsX [Kofleriaceae bacterium]
MRRILVDAMGGDNAPLEIVKGAAQASLGLRNTEIVLVGDAAEIGRILPKCRHDGSRLRIHHAADTIHMDERPAEAIAANPDASILVAAEMIAQGKGDALVSAGNTGASILACAQHWQLLSGITRSALAAVYPTELRRGEKNDPFSLILDVGATVDASADNLVAFALMGAAYARIISHNPRPRVALLSNGTEAGKGPKSVVLAHEMLINASGLNFIGNIEGLDIPRGVADVVVCSGYVGNVVVKMLEGVSDTIMNLARYAYKEKLMWRAALALLSSGIGRLKDITDWAQYGGAPLLGFDHLFIKAHGRSKANAISNAIRVADKSLRSDLCGSIETLMHDFDNTLQRTT